MNVTIVWWDGREETYADVKMVVVPTHQPVKIAANAPLPAIVILDSEGDEDASQGE